MLEGILGVILSAYIIIGLILAIYFYITSPYCSILQAAMILFLWPLILIFAYFVYGFGKKKEEDCGC